MTRNNTQQKEINEHIYKRLQEKYKKFNLPHTWANVYHPRKESNLTHMLRAGIATPNSQSSYSPQVRKSCYKKKQVQSISYSLNSMLTPSPISPNNNAMLSTQFNSKNCIPLFSNSNSDQHLKTNGTVYIADNDVQFNLFEMDVSKNSSSQPCLITNSKGNKDNLKKVTNNTNQCFDFSNSLKKAFDRTIDLGINLKDKQASISEINFHNTHSSPEFINDIKKKYYGTQNDKFSPFVNFQHLTQEEQKISEEVFISSSEVFIALLYSDNTSHLGIATTEKMSDEKITVSAICFLYITDDSLNNFGLLVPVSASGENDDRIIAFLHKILFSDTLKVTFNAYQLYIVCNILTKTRMKHHNLKNIIDLKIASWLLNSDEVPQSLLDLEKRFFPVNEFTGKGFLNNLYFSLEKLSELKKSVYKMLDDEKLLNLFIYLECPLLSTICQMGQTGISINKKKFDYLSKYLDQRLLEIEKKADDIVGRKILLTSPIQLRQLLYDELKLDDKIKDSMARTTATKEKSTSEACLLKIADLHPLPRVILSHRKINKCKSTYIDGLRQYMRFGKLYPSWDQTSASTGRLAAFNPNVQAFPKGSVDIYDTGINDCHLVRDIIVPSPGYKFVAVDFCSIELRVLAHFTKDQELLELFKQSGDIFTTLTSFWKEIPYDNITPDERNRTKRVCYAIIYGVGVPKLSQFLEISLSEAKIIMNSFLNKFKNITKFTNAVINKARQTKKLRTILNRLRHFSEINNNNFALRKSIERQAVNFVIQGSAADICKVAMLKLSDYLQTNTCINSKLLIQIHDELLYEVHQDNFIQFSNAIYQILESPKFTSEIHLSVPLKVKVQHGESWGSMCEYFSPS